MCRGIAGSDGALCLAVERRKGRDLTGRFLRLVRAPRQEAKRDKLSRHWHWRSRWLSWSSPCLRAWPGLWLFRHSSESRRSHEAANHSAPRLEVAWMLARGAFAGACSVEVQRGGEFRRRIADKRSGRGMRGPHACVAAYRKCNRSQGQALRAACGRPGHRSHFSREQTVARRRCRTRWESCVRARGEVGC